MLDFQKDAHRTSLLTSANFFLPTKQSVYHSNISMLFNH